jgi:hypothetical protein
VREREVREVHVLGPEPKPPGEPAPAPGEVAVVAERRLRPSRRARGDEDERRVVGSRARGRSVGGRREQLREGEAALGSGPVARDENVEIGTALAEDPQRQERIGCVGVRLVDERPCLRQLDDEGELRRGEAVVDADVQRAARPRASERDDVLRAVRYGADDAVAAVDAEPAVRAGQRRDCLPELAVARRPAAEDERCAIRPARARGLQRLGERLLLGLRLQLPSRML